MSLKYVLKSVAVTISLDIIPSL